MHEIEETLREIEDDANEAGGLTIDQRIAIEGIRASLASVAASKAQTEGMERYSAIASRVADWASDERDAALAAPSSLDAAESGAEQDG